MIKKLYIILFISIWALSSQAQVLPNFGGERAGLSTLSFLKNDLNPRSIAMAGSSVSLSGDAYSVLTNPAALGGLENNSYAASHLFLGGGINQSLLTGNYLLKDKISHLAFSINSLNSGEMEERTEFQPLGTGRQVYVSNLALGISYARELSKVFSAGISLKYIYEGIANYSNHNATVDVSFLYKTDFKSLQFAVMVQNFGGNSALGNTDEDIPVVYNRTTGINLDANTVPTVFSLGLSFKPLEEDHQSLTASIQLNHPNDNAENFRLGFEYEIRQLFFVRTGYKMSVKGQHLPTFGFGLRSKMGGRPLYIDYAINPTNFLGFQHSIGLRLDILNNER
tara:strand:+ start:143147 stop:144160 length:1014 start_codon:yes stop_codon:yes gene_type:complete